MTSNPQIIADLKVIMEKDQPLELLSTYKGVPFVCKAKVLEVDQDKARLTTQDPSLICMTQDPLAKVLGSDYFEPAIAEIGDVDLRNGCIELTNFSYIGAKLGERMIVRVEPRDSTHVLLESLDIKTSAELVDISISGLGLRVAHADFHAALKPGASLRIHMQISSAEINVSGTVLSAFKTDEFYRLSIRFAQDITQRSLIFKYLIDRRHEIEEEVRSEFQKHRESGG
jgi:hypothetical protein